MSQEHFQFYHTPVTVACAEALHTISFEVVLGKPGQDTDLAEFGKLYLKAAEFAMHEQDAYTFVKANLSSVLVAYSEEQPTMVSAVRVAGVRNRERELEYDGWDPFLGPWVESVRRVVEYLMNAINQPEAEITFTGNSCQHHKEVYFHTTILKRKENVYDAD